MPMPPTSPYVIALDPDERGALQALTRRSTSAYRLVLRARIVLAAADGVTNTAIASRHGVHVDTVRKWRRRFWQRRLEGLADADRPGRPPVFTPVQQAQVKALACELPADHGVPLSRWSAAELAGEAVTAGIVADISGSTVARWLAADVIKPWQHRSWIFPRDPDFAAKADRVLDLYARTWQGQALGADEFVISADEKTSVQARCRCHPTLPPGRSRLMRVEHEYDRGGALAYLAALDVHRGKVYGRCEPTTGLAPFARLVEQVMTREPYASARRVFWIVDNGSSHRGQASIDRMTAAWPTATVVHTPLHASWLNQVEIYFSIVQRKVVTPNDFYDLADVENRLEAFHDHYNLGARPFNWRYTKKDLDALLKRLATHTPLPTAA
ncbi:IS630 family transposase [Micromonospora yasonensis]|uniref:IS630 family transposase n=1 Tax=Micromonospora yasonensis TaxID=1128667 RepID=UPI0022314917|nr:IS630 family transposase [Micromonospora yasonensis]MCW3838496.1 IS630 family transposase [Micromonospora yasonensis]